MAYSVELLEKARGILEERRKSAEEAAESRHREVIKKCPEIGVIENEIASAGLNIIKCLGMKSDDAKRYIDSLAEQNISAQEKKADLLKENGFDRDYLEIPYACKKCEDTGFADGKFCECHLKLLKQLACEELSKTSRLSLSSFDSFRLDYYSNESDREKMDDIFNYCKDYSADFSTESPNLYFYGDTGLGKTHLSLAIADKVVKKGYNVVYGSAQNLLSKIEREKFGKSDDPDGTTEEKLLDCDLLILDDLGAEFSTQFTVSAIYNIVNTRINAGLPTIISTNLEYEEIEKKYSQRIASRIIGNYVTIGFCGEDIRQIKANE